MVPDLEAQKQIRIYSLASQNVNLSLMFSFPLVSYLIISGILSVLYIQVILIIYSRLDYLPGQMGP